MKKILSLVMCFVFILGFTFVPVKADSAVDEYLKFEADLLRGIENCQTTKIDIKKYKIPKNETEDVMNTFYQRLYYHYPEYDFYVDRNYTYYDRNGYTEAIQFKYLYSKSTITNMKKQISDAVAPVLNEIDRRWSDKEKALYIHDWLAVNYMYDLRLFDKNQESNTVYDMYNFLTQKTGVCMAYALTYLYILRLCGIDSYFIESLEGNHSWNIVKINGIWYHVDVTHDDPLVSYYTYDFVGKVSHEYFLVGQNELQQIDASKNNGVVGSHCDDMTAPASFDGTIYIGSPITSYNSYKNSVSAVHKIGLYWYYLDEKMGGLVRTTNFRNVEKVVDIDNYWNTSSGSYYSQMFFTGLYENNGILYFTDERSLYSYSPLTKKTRRLYDIYTDTYGFIYGFYFDDDHIYFFLRDELPQNIKGEKYTIGTYTLQFSNHIESNEWVTLEEATDSSSGVQVRYCTTCGKIMETRVLSIAGDINGDGEVNATDLAKIKISLADNNTSSLSSGADLNGDGYVTIIDLAMIKILLANKK